RKQSMTSTRCVGVISMSTRRAMPLITVCDLDAAIEAYRRLTGMEVVMNHGWIATLSPPGDRSIQISLIASDPTAPVNPAVSVEVDDLDVAYRIARENGWEIVHDLAVEEWGVRRFFFRDADGNIVNVLSHL
ncbi:MAG: VOC family protein, partial [Actinomyces oris]